MKKLLLLFLILTSFKISYSQVGNSPYPIIFVHGLNSDEQTWDTVVNYMDNSFSISGNNRFSAILNARGGDTTNYLQDVMIPSLDENGIQVNRFINSNIFLVNFRNFWNRNSNDPRILIHSDVTPGSYQSPSNQSAIYKQGYALGICIDSVLRVTGASKVILVGHSMGGLAIREYLQRIENNSHIWWINPNETDGHKVAKVVTIGTPHLGSNASTWDPPFFIVDEYSEAVRDLRNSFPSIYNYDGSYLFGGMEEYIPIVYYNNDINCDGTSGGQIIGLNTNESYNQDLALPQNIEYTWIISEYLFLNGDLIVDLDKQWLKVNNVPSPLYISDTLKTNKKHWEEPEDKFTIIRGLDEPDDMTFAYPLQFNKTYSGFVTSQSNGNTMDYDYYKVTAPESGYLTVSINGNNAGLSGLEILSNTGDVISSIPITSSGLLSNTVAAGIYFIRVRGFGDQNSNFKSYRLVTYFDNQVTYYGIESKPTGGNWNDTNTWVGNVIPTANDNVIINGTVNVTPNAVCNNIVIVDTLQTKFEAYCAPLYYTLTVNGTIVNNGLIRNDPVGYVCWQTQTYYTYLILDLKGNLINNGAWTPLETHLSGNTTQYISHAPGKPLGSNFMNYDTNRAIEPLTDLVFTENFNLNNGRLLMGNKYLSGNVQYGKIDNGYTHNSYLYNIHFIGTSDIKNSILHDAIIDKASLRGIVSVVNSLIINDSIFVVDTLQTKFQNYCGPVNYTMTVKGTIVNNGLIRNDPVGYVCWQTQTYYTYLILDLKGNLINNGIWNNYSNNLYFENLNERIISIKNSSDSNVTINGTQITGINANLFLILSGGGSNTILPGSTHTIRILFTQNGNTDKNALLNIECNQIGSLNNISLQGTGAGQSLSLNLEAFLEGFYSPVSTSNNILNSKVISDIKSIKKEVKGSKNNIKYDKNFSDNLLNNVQDSIAVYLAQSSSPFTIVDSTKSILSDSGMANCNFSNVSHGNYFIIIRHRNHIETWSSTAVTFTSGSNVNYDFTSSQSQALGNNLVQIGNEWCIYSGDVNQDGLIELKDLLFIYNDVSNFSSGYLVTDINGDNYTDLTDLLIAFNNSVKFIAKITP